MNSGLRQHRLFFPVFSRGNNYPVKSDGSHYHYTHYRQFRPESLFSLISNQPSNLHYSCGRCNLLKSNHWPAGTGTNTFDNSVGFLDPFQDDREYFFEICANGEIVALKPPGYYLVRLLQLNRDHLRKLRERRLLVDKLRTYLVEAMRQANDDLAAGRSTDTARYIELGDLTSRLLTFFANV